ncbi:indolepyruvate ferredoxin oxidoreductase subunit alpha [Desulfofustis limnaeus]|jgi:indolepyruvate ferredoxin oxidoreductase alpha subunit|uniref:Indolepyruvate oxidoreductase subunit IorA n=1 Tax=Desulfofustis limnaeus TaxID=2740163 RepID=A0ABM7W6S3_9BACT|nr:indolepyruvate ferredoxin oxidoreductase subunit alpha [Desulfofustis limnaeus]MDX9896789.1 indolepyruvate ferredoxin oxidoreductase subunit alpha [Desulfofustis sp.]BDD86588.1 indolepyruvate oxidoreductase subunit IorA [Desulfofustis limnaeus]
MTERTADTIRWLSGNEAIALGAWEAGVRVASGYPGTPSTEIMEHLSGYEGVYTEWAPNEKVALEVAIGASFAGGRALATMKHVGLNVAADPLFTAAYTGGRGGLVILTADDPDMHSSQNEQDNRNYALAAKLPMLEPSDPAESREFVKIAFALSEELDTPVLLRITTRIAHVKGVVGTGERVESPLQPRIEKHPEKFVMLPAMARRRRLHVEERMQRSRALAETVPYNRVEAGDRKRGFITSSVSYLYVKEAFPEATVLKLGMCWPLPEKKIRDFAASVDELFIVEELDPFLETQIKAMGIPCRGKELIPAIGELNTAIVRKAIDPGRQPVELFESVPLPPRPPNMCPGCPHRGIFFNLSRMKLFVSGDIGCYTLGFLPPLNALDTTVCMGASIPMAHGMVKAIGPEANQQVVSVIGDSTFVHSGITGLINSVYNGSAATLIILDNRITAMTGQQPNPASGTSIKGEPAQSLDLEALCRAVGVKHVRVVNPHEVPECRKIIKEEVERDEMSVIIARAPCVLLPELKLRKPVSYYTNIDNCVGCTSCIRLGCPAISWHPLAEGEAEARGYKKSQKGYSQIDEVLCNDCGQCASLCKFNAITRGEPK